MKTAGRWLIILIATTLASTPLPGQEVDAPEPHWNMAAFDGQATDRESAATAQTPKDPDKQQGEKQKIADDQDSHQRLLGLAPMFTVVNDASKARPLSPREKWKLFYRQTYDPFQFVTTAFVAAINQAQDSLPEYGQGMKGYGKRYGAAFADNSLGGFFGNFALPSLLHDDPRYFRKGSEPVMHRLLYAAGTSVIARHDNGTHHPNYSNVLGNLMGTAIGNLYYPANDRTVSNTVSRGLQVTGYGAIGGIFQEFWPDIHDKIFKKHAAPAAK